MTLFVVVENAGYEGERIVKQSRDIMLCIGWMNRAYAEDERIGMHVDIALQRTDGSLSYEY